MTEEGKGHAYVVKIKVLPVEEDVTLWSVSKLRAQSGRIGALLVEVTLSAFEDLVQVRLKLFGQLFLARQERLECSADDRPVHRGL